MYSNKQEVALQILKQIEEAIERIQLRTEPIHCADDFLLTPTGMEKLESTCLLLLVIGESLKNLDKVTEGKLLPTYPSIPWKKVKGLRDIIAHHYFDIDAEEIWIILKEELSPLLIAIRYFIQRLNNEISD